MYQNIQILSQNGSERAINFVMHGKQNVGWSFGH